MGKRNAVEQQVVNLQPLTKLEAFKATWRSPPSFVVPLAPNWVDLTGRVILNVQSRSIEAELSLAGKSPVLRLTVVAAENVTHTTVQVNALLTRANQHADGAKVLCDQDAQRIIVIGASPCAPNRPSVAVARSFVFTNVRRVLTSSALDAAITLAGATWCTRLVYT